MPRSTAEASLSIGALRERWMPLLSHQVDGERAHALGLQLGSESREILGAHGCSFGRVVRRFGAERVPRATAAQAAQRLIAARLVTLRELVGRARRHRLGQPRSRAGGAGEMEIARFIAGWLEAAGVEARVEEVAPGRANVIGVARGHRRRPHAAAQRRTPTPSGTTATSVRSSRGSRAIASTAGAAST